MIYFLRSLFPQWNFFDEVGNNFTFWLKETPDQPWTKLEFNSTYSLKNLFINSAHNEKLAELSFLQNFCSRLQLDLLEANTNFDEKNLTKQLKLNYEKHPAYLTFCEILKKQVLFKSGYFKITLNNEMKNLKKDYLFLEGQFK